MEIHPITWLVSVGVIVVIIVIDFYAHVRRAHKPSLKESATWVGIYVGLTLLFGLGLGLMSGWRAGGEFLAGYLTEESLSLDNLFVFLIIMAKFRVPKEAEQKVLLVGVAVALILRAVFILLGAVVIERFAPVFYLFGAFLLYTAVKLVIDHRRKLRGEQEDYAESWLVRGMRRVLRATPDYVGDRVRAEVDGRRAFTPLLLVMVAIGSTDVLFAMDSIPAIFGLTQEPYIVFMANACALMGLRQLYFLIGGLVERLPYLSHGLSVILGFIGVKLVLEALARNDLPFLNGGQPISVWHIPVWLSLAVIVVTMAGVVVASWVSARRASRAS